MKTTELSERLQDWQKQATTKAREIGSATDDYVRENVWSSIALAAVVGCVVGFLVGRNRD